MYPILPSDVLIGGWELIGYAFTLLAAAASYLLALR